MAANGQFRLRRFIQVPFNQETIFCFLRKHYYKPVFLAYLQMAMKSRQSGEKEAMNLWSCWIFISETLMPIHLRRLAAME